MQEGYIMSHLSTVPRFAYMLTKIVNELAVYVEDGENIKSYDIKNALIYTMEEDMEYGIVVDHTEYDTCASKGSKGNEALSARDTATTSRSSWSNQPIYQRKEPVPGGDIEITDKLLLQVREFTWKMCNVTLRRMVRTDEMYYFGFGRCRNRDKNYEIFMKYVKYVLRK